MSDSLQDLSLLLIGSCIFLLAIVNMYLVWRLIKGVRFEDERLDSIAAYNQQILSQQLSVRKIVSDPMFLSMLKGLAAPAAPATPPPPAASQGEDAELDAALKKGVNALGDTATGFADLFGSLNEAKDMASWKAANQARISELLRSQNGLKGEVEQLQALLAKANATVLNLRARGLQAANSEAESKEIDALKAGIAARDSKIAAAEAVMKNEKTRFEEEKKKLEEKIFELQATHDRTLVEKNFIEEAFIEETKEKPAA